MLDSSLPSGLWPTLFLLPVLLAHPAPHFKRPEHSWSGSNTQSSTEKNPTTAPWPMFPSPHLLWVLFTKKYAVTILYPFSPLLRGRVIWGLLVSS